MPDEATIAESSTATETTVPPIESWTGAQYDKWRATGETPTPIPVTTEPQTEESAPPKPAAEGAKPEAETAPASEPEKSQEPPKGKGVKARTAELDADIQRLQDRLARRRELRQELESLEGEKGRAATESPAAPETSDKEPLFGDFLAAAEKKSETYEQAVQAFQRAHSQWAIEQHEARKTEKQERDRIAELARQHQAKEDRFAAEHEDYEATVKSPAANAIKFDPPRFNALNAYLLESDNPGAVRYYLAKDLPTLTKLSQLNPIAMVRELAKFELSLNGTNGTSGPTVVPNPKTHSALPPPPTELSGRNSAPADEIEDAVVRNDAGAYIQRMNAIELKKRQRA